MAYLKAVLPNTRRSVKSTSTHELDRDRGIFLCLYRNLSQGMSNTPEKHSSRNLKILKGRVCEVSWSVQPKKKVEVVSATRRRGSEYKNRMSREEENNKPHNTKVVIQFVIIQISIGMPNITQQDSRYVYLLSTKHRVTGI